MTKTEIQEVISHYQRTLTEDLIEAERISGNQVGPPSNGQQLRHALWMTGEIQDQLNQPDFNEGKVFRWLGFLQGVLWAVGVFTLEEMKDHNRGPKVHDLVV